MVKTVRLDDLRACMDGVVPAAIATCAADGTPNVSYLSQVEYVDAEHVALSFQFFNKTRNNILHNPQATVEVVHPGTGCSYELSLLYLRTETTGPVFERMKARLAGIANHEGMTAVFRLQGADIYRVLDIRGPSDGDESPAALARPPRLAATRACVTRMASCGDLHELLDTTLAELDARLGIRQSMILMLDTVGQKVFAVASRGYPLSGAGAEVPLGHGVIGAAARERCAIRISFAAPEYGYGRAIRASAAEGTQEIDTAIPFAGLENPGSQIAVPILDRQRLLGVLYADCEQILRFDHEDEDALSLVALQLGSAILSLPPDAEAPIAASPPVANTGSRRIVVRRFAGTDSVFLDGEYLIKGIAGAILWTLVCDHVHGGRSDFTNRALRLDPRLRLPDINDNLEARLILLERRLVDRGAPIRLVKTGRGRFALKVDGTLELHDVPAP